LHQFLDAAEGTTADGALGDEGKPALDLIEPRGVSRSVVNLVSRPLRQPGPYLRMLVRSVIIDDEVNVKFGRDALVQSAQKREELLMPMTRLAFGEHCTGGNVQRGKQGCRSVTDIVMGHALDITETHWQDGLSAIQCLNLAFLIDAQYQRMIGRVEIKSGNVPHLFDEERIVGELKGA